MFCTAFQSGAYIGRLFSSVVVMNRFAYYLFFFPFFFLLAFFLSPLLLLLLLLCQADIAKSGEISIEDFRAILLRSKQFNRKEVDEIFDGLDIGSSGLLSYTDFTAAALDR